MIINVKATGEEVVTVLNLANFQCWLKDFYRLFIHFSCRPDDVRQDGALCYASRRSYATMKFDVPALKLHPVSVSKEELLICIFFVRI